MFASTLYCIKDVCYLLWSLLNLFPSEETNIEHALTEEENSTCLVYNQTVHNYVCLSLMNHGLKSNAF